ncbi:MAG TPA: putative PEP-binding protein, partial [Gammaproteobacteria bacterium]|nr:putative PEP-binding protein [Gammaproteobacteria bacterium]
GADLFHGVMFEVPAACLDAERIFRHIDFGRIGTNDLVQYLFMPEHPNNTIEPDELFDSPLLWNLIADLVKVAGNHSGRLWHSAERSLARLARPRKSCMPESERSARTRDVWPPCVRRPYALPLTCSNKGFPK